MQWQVTALVASVVSCRQLAPYVVAETSQNAEDIESFTKQIEALTETLNRATEGGGSLSKPMLDRIDRLLK